jgi:hypothetical protein
VAVYGFAAPLEEFAKPREHIRRAGGPRRHDVIELPEAFEGRFELLPREFGSERKFAPDVYLADVSSC